MSGRWFIGALVCFACVVAAMWAYINRGAADDPFLSRRAPTGLFDLPSAATANRPKSTPVAETATVDSAQVSTGRSYKNAGRSLGSWQSLSTAIQGLAQRADDLSVRMRSDLGRSSMAAVAGGLSDARAGRHAAALEHYAAALRRSPDNPDILALQAESLTALGRTAEARALYEAILAESPDHVVALYNFGVLLYRLSLFHDSAEMFRRAVAARPDHARAQYNLASLAQRAGRLAEARRAWEAYTRLEPSVASGWLNLGIVLMDYQRSAEAAECFARALELDAQDPYLYVNLALAYLADGAPDLAMEAIRVADELLPCDPVVMDHLASIHEAMAGPTNQDAGHHRREADRLRNEVAMLASGAEAPR